MGSFDKLLRLLAQIPDPRRAEGKIYALPYVLLFAILAIVTGSNSYRGVRTFIKIHLGSLNAAFGLNWKRAPAHTAIRYILQGLDPAAVEQVFRQHAAKLDAGKGGTGQRSIAIDGKTLKHSFDNFHDRKAAQILSAFSTQTGLVLAHAGIDDASNEIPAAQQLLAELNVAHRIVTLDALHCQKNLRGCRGSRSAPDRSAQGQPARAAAARGSGCGHHVSARGDHHSREGAQPQ
jgi:hypothetical protein